jgi:hypothetical protein
MGGRGARRAALGRHWGRRARRCAVRYRRGYAPGVWHSAIRVNDNDVSTGSWTALNWTPRDSGNNNELSYGLVYFYSTTPYFNRFQRLTGDLNCDDLVNTFDIDPFVLALTSPDAYEAVFPDCDRMAADVNCDGLVNAFDIDRSY